MHKMATDTLERYAYGGTWWLDLESDELWWSTGIYKLHGVDPETYIPAPEKALDFYAGESGERLNQAIAEAVENHTGWNLTLQIRRADGALRYVQSIGQVDPREGLRPLVAGALLDVHAQMMERQARRALQRRLAEDSKRWRVASENAGLSLIEIDVDASRYTIQGALARRIGEDDVEEFVLSAEEWLTYLHPDDWDARSRCLDDHLSGHAPAYVCEYRLCLADREIWVREEGRQTRAGGGPRVLGTLSDIDARKHSEFALQEARRRLEQTLSRAPIGIALVSPDGHWLSVNRALCDMLGYTESEFMGLTFQDITHPDDLEADLAYVEALLAGRRRTYRMEKRYFDKQGQIVEIQLDVSLLRDDAGAPLHFISQIQDITERKREHRALFKANELARVTFDAIGEGLIRTDRSGVIEQVNTSACVLLAAQPAGLVGQRFGEMICLYDAEKDRAIPDPAVEVLSSGERMRVPIFTRLRRLDGQFISIVDSFSPICDEDGAVSGMVFVFQDISEARRMTDELVHQASHDALTGLPNRRGFADALAYTWQRVRSGMAQAYVMYLDLDHFKTINDTCGHAAGDELLRQLAVALRALLRESDVLARLGGDEFAAIIYARNDQGAGTVADKFLQAVDNLRFTYEQRAYRVGVSIGIAALEGALESTETALIHADAALYIAKDSGRNRYHLYHTNTQTVPSAAAYTNTAQLLQSGLEQDRFMLYLQAITDATGRVLGYEALLRFQSEDGVITPDDFLPTAKRLGMMSRIDRWVVTEALNLLREFDQRDQWPAGCYLSVNISPISLADPQFHAELVALFEQHRLDGRRLAFEVTESAELFGEHYPRLIENLRERGCSVWLDDFATGYNSFDMLKRVAVDGIKIDRSFVQDIESDPIDRAVVHSIGDVSGELSLQVVAEGVENQSMLNMLVEAGFERFQGYFFHRPEAAEEAIARHGSEIASSS